MIVRGSLCRSEFNVVASSVGWSIASLVATRWAFKPLINAIRYVPIWVGTRGLEFDWKYLCLSYEANLDLVRMHIILSDSFRLIHLWCFILFGYCHVAQALLGALYWAFSPLWRGQLKVYSMRKFTLKLNVHLCSHIFWNLVCRI